MAEESDQERSLPATPRRLEQAREEGRVPRSRELAAWASVAAAAAGAWVAGPAFVGACRRVLEAGLTFSRADAFGERAVAEHLTRQIADALVILLPVAAVAAVVAIVASVAIGGWLVAPQALALDLKRIDPLAGLARLFSARGAAELGKAIAKALVIALVAVAFFHASRDALAALGGMSTADGLAALGVLVRQSLLWFAGGLALIAAIDVPLAIWQHRRELRMTPEELRREMRETEGDPQLKARIRSQQREIARRRMMAEVPKADVVVTNPTHFAVALAYRAAGAGAPRVVAKGRGEIALRIRSLANSSAVPVLEAPPLARALYHSTELGDEIPAALYGAVAQVLAWVYQLRRAHVAGGPHPEPPGAIDVPPELDRETEADA